MQVGALKHRGERGMKSGAPLLTGAPGRLGLDTTPINTRNSAESAYHKISSFYGVALQ